MRRITRAARAIVASGAACAMLLTAGCSAGAPDDGPVTLSFWGWVPGIEDAVDLWNEQHPDTQIEFTRVASADAANLPSQIDAGTAPDIAQLEAKALMGLVVDQQVQDLAEHIGGSESEFTESSWAGVSLGEGVYGVPQDSAPNALMYRADIFEQHGIEVPATWDEYIAAAEALRAADPEVYLAQFSPNSGMFQVDQLQAGNQWFAAEGDAWAVGIADEDVRPVADRYQHLLDNDLVKVEQMWTPEYWTDVNSGVIASINYAAWFPTLLEENAPSLSGKWAVAPSPSETGDGPSSDLGGSVNIVTKDAEHAAQAAEFLLWLNTDPASLEILISEGGLFPAAVAGFDNPALTAPSDYWGGAVISDVFIAAAENTSTGSVAGPAYGAADAALADGFAQVVNGELTFWEALEAADAEAESAIESLGLTVK